MLLENENKLLEDVLNIQEGNRLRKKHTGIDFNIFEITNIITQEVQLCKFIYEIISPLGRHYQKDIYLKLFLEDVLNIDLNTFTEGEWKSLEVFREYVCVSSRRIDLLIRTNKRFIPIEVKVYAKDQLQQCYDYWQVANKARPNNKDIKIYYLSIDGHYPSEESITNVSKTEKLEIENIRCISFEKHILKWLRHCLDLEETKKVQSLYEILSQFYYAVENVTNKRSDNASMDIQSLIQQSPNNLFSACRIAKEFEQIKLKNIYKLFDQIERKIDCKRLTKDIDNALIENLYKNGNPPGLNYFYKKIDDINEIWARMELNKENGSFCFGYIMIENKQRICRRNLFKVTNEKILECTKWNKEVLTKYDDDSWLCRASFDDMYPNFKTFDKNYMEIFGDENNFNRFVFSCVEHILKLLSK